MSDPAARAIEQFPTIQITLVSIVVALSLEHLLDELPTIEAMWEPTVVAAIVWSQAVVAFTLIVKMSAGFILNAIVLRRVPRSVDFLAPLGLLVFVDVQIASIGPDHLLRWWYVLAAGTLFAASYLYTQGAEERSVLDTSTRARDRTRIAVRVELALGSVATAIAVLHHWLELAPPVMLTFVVVYLLLEVSSAAGPLMAWNALRRVSDARSGQSPLPDDSAN